MDEASFVPGGNKAGYGRGRKGEPRTAPVILSREGKYVFGVLSNDDFYFKAYDAQNTRTFIEFPGAVRKGSGPVLMFLDNASWHKAKAVRQYVRKCGDIKLKHFLPYTPEPNVIGTGWRVIRDAMGNRVYDDLRSMLESLSIMLSNKEIPKVNMSRCLAC